MSLNIKWALRELENFSAMTSLVRKSGQVGTRRMNNQSPDEEIVRQAPVVEQILDAVLPNWRSSVPSDKNQTINRWIQHREAAQRAATILLRQEEVRENLGDTAPQLSASAMHPWVWGSVQGLWGSGHYREAVGAAARAINAHAQSKLSRRDLSESKLLGDAFTTKPAEPGRPRLRLGVDDGGETYRNRQDGAANFARGVYSAIRNPIAHEEGDELTENEALEMLAAFSLLAKWIDEATLETAPQP